ncbi:MAG: aminotransferase class I/II-fold pyridoxal phosphate-dependent enzyme, partial [Candidatus Aenigmarchaeota archaeon]|nr:aminotransferase class I/II-fold pyridoxal phosphate-dependent enzyme [Candidatus Aenigmarchaeota archaeon]
IEEQLWQTDIDDLRKKVTPRTKAICAINPNNPTGSVLHRKALQEIIDIAGEHNIPVISDEIYDKLVFDVEHIPMASLASDVAVIGLNGFSKVYLMPGWRLGYMYFHDPNGMMEEIKHGVQALCRQRLSAHTPVQKACIRAFENDSHIHEMVRKLKERAYFAHRRLNEIGGISSVKPEGAFYIFPKVELNGLWKDDHEFVLDVLNNTGIVLAHGSGFDPVYGKDHFRSVILPPIETLEEAFGKLEEFMNRKQAAG